MKNREDVFDENLKYLHKGSLPEEIVLSLTEKDKENFLSLFKIAKRITELPKKSIPKPVMQKKFILLPIKTFWFSWLHLSRLATVSASAILLITALAGTGYAAMRSVPGQTLFSVKKSAEQIQLKLARNPEAKANLQLELSKKRLSDAEKVLKNPASGSYQTKAVITELITQTQNTIEEVNKVAKSESDFKKTQPIVKSLESLAVEQQQLIKEIKPVEEKMVADAEKATQETATKLAEIKKYIQIASNEQTLVELKSSEKTDTDNTNIDQKNEDNIEIITNTKPAPTSTTQSVKESVEPETIEKDPNTVTGTFIIEDPSPQFKP